MKLMKPRNLPSNYYWQEVRDSMGTTFATDCFFRVQHPYYNRQGALSYIEADSGNQAYDRYWMLPCYPESISESQGSTWSPVSPLGRSSPLSAFTGTGYRNFGINLKLHREMLDDEDYIDKLLAEFRRTQYPWYVAQGLVPPVATFQFGEFRCKGYIDNVSYNWQKPIVDGHYQLCDVTMSFTEVPDKVFSAQELSDMPTNPFGVDPLARW